MYITLIDESPLALYSGMVPGCIAGIYSGAGMDLCLWSWRCEAYVECICTSGACVRVECVYTGGGLYVVASETDNQLEVCHTPETCACLTQRDIYLSDLNIDLLFLYGPVCSSICSIR